MSCACGDVWGVAMSPPADSMVFIFKVTCTNGCYVQHYMLADGALNNSSHFFVISILFVDESQNKDSCELSVNLLTCESELDFEIMKISILVMTIWAGGLAVSGRNFRALRSDWYWP